VFGVTYSGMGHEAAGRMMPVEVGLAFVAALIVAGLLSLASDRVLSTWLRRTGFVAAIGLLLAAAADLSRFGIGGCPAGSGRGHGCRPSGRMGAGRPGDGVGHAAAGERAWPRVRA